MEFNRETIVAAFLAESQEGLLAAEQQALAAEANPANRESLDEIFRVAHTLKGNAATLGFSGLAGLAHVVEDLLDALRNKRLAVSAEVISIILNATDALRALVVRACEGNDNLTSLDEELKTLIAKKVAEAGRSRDLDTSQEHPSSAAIAGPAIQADRHRSLRVEVSKLDRMLNLSGEVAVVQGRLRRIIEDLNDNSKRQILELFGECERLHQELQEQVMSARMVPVGPLFQHLMRAVRDISRSQKKLARLEVAGNEVEVDTRVLEHLRDPLLHMIRNAIDHGIEFPEIRTANHKSSCGTLRLKASQVAGNIVIQISDDGAGFNRKRILEKAKAAGVVDDADKLTDQEVFQLVFRAGFTTADEVTEISGRGVGMDVVRRNIEALRGGIDIQSTEGCGSTVTLLLPLTLAIIDGFSVVSGHETYVIPLDTISECLDLPEDYIANEHGGVMNLRGEPLPFVRLRDVLGAGGAEGKRQNVVVLEYEGGRAGLAVDELLGESQSIIKPLDRLFQKVRGIAGSTILSDGRVALILDVNTLMRGAITECSVH